MPVLSTGKYVTEADAEITAKQERAFVETLYRVGREKGLSDERIAGSAQPHIERAEMFERAIQ